ncbi:MAG: MinD/ParA family protein [Pseudomonadota bacterium]|uniref:MinD/ParA family protein n=1 Tax=Candidatus Desulfatibia profunda TaxID=2841695 RepID=A0A8J6TMI2_9BACT|nr:MinD/ParA family protein [Candidatus Desulfatibia profunda]MBL7179782.1 MinD/ParA family protein [Desulfobacterales bacterium]MBU0698989.1 MinD/ParA family protein [Pseudomonadota bacterium]
MDQATNLRRIVKAESGKFRKLKTPGENRSFSATNIPTVIAVTSGKGGVGKTNVVGNLAVAYQQMGNRVLIFDADLGLANIDIIFGINPRFTIEDVIKGEKELSQIIVEGPEGVAIIPASSGVQEMAHLSEGHKINLLNEFDMLNSRFDLLLIDTSAGISSNVIYFNLAAQERIVVVTPEPTSITDAYALMKVMFNQHGTKNFSLLMNMVKDEKEARAVYTHMAKVAARFMASICIDYVGYIPWDKYLLEAVIRREPVTCCYPEASSSHGFKQLAKTLLSRSNGRPNDGNIKFFWKRLMTRAVD